jgi:Spy/CpxP family protein refolding chaperone
MLKKIWMIALCTGFVMMPWVARAQQGMPPAAGPSAFEEKMSAQQEKDEQELGLSPEQRQKMKDLRQEVQAKQSALRKELDTKRAALKTELESDNPNRGKVDGFVADLKALQGKTLDNRIDLIFKMRAILTPDQYKKLKALRQKHQAEGGGMKAKPREKTHDKKGRFDK